MIFLLVSLVFASKQLVFDGDSLKSADRPHVLPWETYKKTFRKSYLTEKEHATRQAIYQDNVEFIKAHNAKNLEFKLGVNDFADLTQKEYAQIYLRPYNRTRMNRVVRLNKTEVTSIDWRDHNAVTPVKNQGQCGSCWSFSTTGSTEGAVAIKTGTLTSLSEQQLMDCSTKEGNHGCGGGLMDFGFKYIIDNQGIDSEDDYPYKHVDGTCNTQKAQKHVAVISSYQDVEPKDLEQFKAAVSMGPVSIAIEADQRTFQLYHSGVFSGTCGTKLDHGVLTVGFDADYFIVKNSWGDSWGEKGYIRMTTNPSTTGGGRSGQCGMLMQPSYPVAGKAPPPGPTPPPGPSDDWENPFKGSCSSGEMNVTISGVSGAICSPSCTSTCPDAPSGWSGATPQCALKSPTGDKYCALLCQPSDSTSCSPSSSATCKSVQSVGICTYDNSAPGPGPSPSSGPYEKPPCADSEEAVQITGVDGSFCTTTCSLFKRCPTNNAISGQFECALKDASTSKKYCAVLCQPTDSTACNPSGGMTCKSVPGQAGIGICTYSSSLHAKMVEKMLQLNL
jgi:C1A family cysteine protease